MTTLTTIKLEITVFLLLCISKIQLSTASHAAYMVNDTFLPNFVVEDMDSENTVSTPRNSSLTDCQNLGILKPGQKCSFNNLFVQLVKLKGKGSFGHVWKVEYSAARFVAWRTEQRVGAIKFIQYSELDMELAAREINALMKMYQDRVDHVTKIIPHLTTNISTINDTFTTDKTKKIKWIMIGMKCYDINLEWYSVRNARTSNFGAHLLVANLMVCTCMFCYLFFPVYVHVFLSICECTHTQIQTSSALHMLNDVHKISIFDIKPNNIMVVDQKKKFSETDFALIDFGLATSMTHESYQWQLGGTATFVCIC